MDRIILHWTAGADGVTPHEADSYNFLIGRDGTITAGAHPPEAQTAANVAKGSRYYAAHTRACNTNSIGVSLDAMGDANERPFRPGRFPITELQLDVLVTFVADLCLKYRIPVTRRTVLSHAEVQTTLGVKQNGKWDISWLPGMEARGHGPASDRGRLHAGAAARIQGRGRPPLTRAAGGSGACPRQGRR